jgi:hypothetical protein
MSFLVGWRAGWAFGYGRMNSVAERQAAALV